VHLRKWRCRHRGLQSRDQFRALPGRRSGQCLYQSRRRAIAKKEYDRGITDTNVAIKLFPKSTLAYTNRGRAYQLKGDLTHALADFTVAISHDKENPSAYINRALVREQQGDKKGAIADLKRAIASKPRKGKFVNVDADFKRARENLARLSKS
jgi:tetratricopeptide (TPR) repeat protein